MMIDYSDEQINRDIAEWCGFEQRMSRDWDGHGCKYWYAPHGNYRDKLHPPNFLDEIQGLGLLFRYPVPKLRDTFGEIRITFEDWIAGLVIAVEASIEKKVGIRRWVEIANSNPHICESPTRALALAIHKLINETDNEGT